MAPPQTHMKRSGRGQKSIPRPSGMHWAGIGSFLCHLRTTHQPAVARIVHSTLGKYKKNSNWLERRRKSDRQTDKSTHEPFRHKYAFVNACVQEMDTVIKVYRRCGSLNVCIFFINRVFMCFCICVCMSGLISGATKIANHRKRLAAIQKTQAGA